MLKELIYTGLGGALLLKERVDEEIEKLQDKGKLSKEDADTFMKKLQTRGEEEEEKVKEKIKEALKEVIEEMGLATKADIEAFKRKKTKRHIVGTLKLYSPMRVWRVLAYC